MRFAQNTEVSVERSKAEIERMIQRYGADGFVTGWRGTEAVVSFEMKDRRIRFTLPLPDRNDRRFTETPGKKLQRTPDEAMRHWEQACRQRWRALLLCIKAKLEAVEVGIVSFDEEFLPYIVMPNGMTIAERILPQLPTICATGNMPPLLPGPKEQP